MCSHIIMKTTKGTNVRIRQKQKRGTGSMNAHRLHAASKRRRVVYREKVMILLAAVLIAFACLCFIMIESSQSVQAQDPDTAAGTQKFYKSIEIGSGDTLWDLAESYTEGTDISVQEYVCDLMDINQLENDLIHEGQYLTVVYYR